VDLQDSVGTLLGDLDHAMLVVTASAGGRRSGCLVGFFSQCSIEPPRVMVWVSAANHTAPVAAATDVLGVHVLERDQRDLAELFGGETDDRVDKFARCRWHDGPEGVPILDGCHRWLVGRILGRHPTGDHTGYLLEPIAAEAGEWSGQLGALEAQAIEPGHPA
jgi:flavin reductase (DIM6/NTAB) family NADH-FMN oxidoreductase RutF